MKKGAAIPPGWQHVRLGEVASIQTGIAKGARKPRRPIMVPYLRVANVHAGRLDLREIKSIEVEESEVQRYLLRAGDVLMTEGGDFDKLGRGAVWRGEVSTCLHQNHVFAVRPDPTRLLPEYLSLFTDSAHGRRYFQLSSKQSTNLASINSTQLKALPVLLPPLPLQERTMALASTFDTAIEKADTLLAAKRRLKRALMQRLLASHADRPADFQVMKAGEAFSERDERGMRALPLLSVTGGRGVVARDDLERRDTSSEDKSAYKRIVPGDIVYNTMRMWQGVCGLVVREGIVSPAYTVLVPAHGVSSRYCAHLFKQPRMISLFRRYSQGLVDDTLNLKYSQFSRIQLALPKPSDQERAASLLDRLDADIGTTADLLAALRLQKRGVMQKLLSGELQ